MHRAFFGLLIPLLLTWPSVAADWDDAVAAYDAGRYEEAIVIMTPLAKAGMAKAQGTLAHIYSFGHGTTIDDAAAFDWMRRAAEQGDAGAQSKLGQMYLLGQGVEKNDAQALYWLNLAANQFEPSMLALGQVYLEGKYEDPDIDLGLQFLAWSAQLGNRRASAMLGVMLQEIYEVEHNLVKSAIHFQIAVARGCDDLDKEAARALGLLSADELMIY